VTVTLRLNIPKTIAILIFIAFAALVIKPVFAADATSSTTRKENVQKKVEAKKERVETRVTAIKEKIASREAALKTKLATFKDKKKAETAERVNTNLNKINLNQTEQMQKHLDKMSSLLNRLENRVTSATGDIKNPQAAKEAIANARAAIASASSTIKTQAEKDYTIQVTSETKVKTDAQKVRNQLHQDLKAVREKVIGAKQKVSDAIRVAKSGKVMEATSSGQQ